jgi:hypothetical protein
MRARLGVGVLPVSISGHRFEGMRWGQRHISFPHGLHILALGYSRSGSVGDHGRHRYRNTML